MSTIPLSYPLPKEAIGYTLWSLDSDGKPTPIDPCPTCGAARGRDRDTHKTWPCYQPMCREGNALEVEVKR